MTIKEQKSAQSSAQLPPLVGPVVGMLPFGFRPTGGLGATPLAQLHWPLGAPDLPAGATIGDLRREDHICGFAELWMFGPHARGFDARLSLAIAEPTLVHGHLMLLARLFHRRFYRILSCNPTLLAAIPNGRRLIYGEAWVKATPTLGREKSRMLSLIASKKRRLKGHRLRHRVVKALRRAGIEADIMGRGYRGIEDKAEGLAPYRYSIVIENSREAGYITEKLIDAFLTRTVPIYWGAPDIGDFFDGAGMIVCRNRAEIMDAAANLSVADYEKRRDAIEANRKTALKYADVLKAAAHIVRAG